MNIWKVVIWPWNARPQSIWHPCMKFRTNLQPILFEHALLRTDILWGILRLFAVDIFRVLSRILAWNVRVRICVERCDSPFFAWYCYVLYKSIIRIFVSMYILRFNTMAVDRFQYCPLLNGRGESGWCSDVTSNHGAWRRCRGSFPPPWRARQSIIAALWHSHKGDEEKKHTTRFVIFVGNISGETTNV